MPQVVQRLGVPQIKYGTYTGDGSVSQTIDVGFPPDVVIITDPLADADGGTSMFIRFKGDAADRCHHFYTANYLNADLSGAFIDDRVIALTSNGFTVDDDASDQSPNTNTVVYLYIAFGSG